MPDGAASERDGRVVLQPCSGDDVQGRLHPGSPAPVISCPGAVVIGHAGLPMTLPSTMDMAVPQRRRDVDNT